MGSRVRTTTTTTTTTSCTTTDPPFEGFFRTAEHLEDWLVHRRGVRGVDAAVVAPPLYAEGYDEPNKLYNIPLRYLERLGIRTPLVVLLGNVLAQKQRQIGSTQQQQQQQHGETVTHSGTHCCCNAIRVLPVPAASVLARERNTRSPPATVGVPASLDLPSIEPGEAWDVGEDGDGEEEEPRSCFGDDDPPIGGNGVIRHSNRIRNKKKQTKRVWNHRCQIERDDPIVATDADADADADAGEQTDGDGENRASRRRSNGGFAEAPAAVPDVDELELETTAQRLLDEGNYIVANVENFRAVGWHHTSKKRGKKRIDVYYPAAIIGTETTAHKQTKKQKQKQAQKYHIQYIGVNWKDANYETIIRDSRWTPLRCGGNASEKEDELRLAEFLEGIKTMAKFRTNPLNLKLEELAIRTIWEMVRNRNGRGTRVQPEHEEARSSSDRRSASAGAQSSNILLTPMARRSPNHNGLEEDPQQQDGEEESCDSDDHDDDDDDDGKTIALTACDHDDDDKTIPITACDHDHDDDDDDDDDSHHHGEHSSEDPDHEPNNQVETTVDSMQPPRGGRNPNPNRATNDTMNTNTTGIPAASLNVNRSSSKTSPAANTNHETNQPRKRGRPRKWKLNSGDQTRSDNYNAATVAAGTTPGISVNVTPSKPSPAANTNHETNQPRKRGRPRKRKLNSGDQTRSDNYNAAMVAAGTTPGISVNANHSPSKSSPAAANTSHETNQPRKRGRPPKQKVCCEDRTRSDDYNAATVAAGTISNELSEPTHDTNTNTNTNTNTARTDTGNHREMIAVLDNSEGHESRDAACRTTRYACTPAEAAARKESNYMSPNASPANGEESIRTARGLGNNGCPRRTGSSGDDETQNEKPAAREESEPVQVANATGIHKQHEIIELLDDSEDGSSQDKACKKQDKAREIPDTQLSPAEEKRVKRESIARQIMCLSQSSCSPEKRQQMHQATLDFLADSDSDEASVQIGMTRL